MQWWETLKIPITKCVPLRSVMRTQMHRLPQAQAQTQTQTHRHKHRHKRRHKRTGTGAVTNAGTSIHTDSDTDGHSNNNTNTLVYHVHRPPTNNNLPHSIWLSRSLLAPPRSGASGLCISGQYLKTALWWLQSSQLLQSGLCGWPTGTGPYASASFSQRFSSAVSVCYFCLCQHCIQSTTRADRRLPFAAFCQR
jgi:hypothetical protein